MDEHKRQKANHAFAEFLTTPLAARLERSHHADAGQAALDLFHSVVETVPAYREFLAEQGIEAGSIRTYEDFQQLPPLTKQNYILRYPLPELCRNGRLEDCDMVAVSSGSTGKPCFWPRFFADELEIAWRFEQVFHDSFDADERPTLAVVCFTLGTWVGGMYTAHCCRYLAAKGYPITLVTPGNNREEIFRAVQELGPFFDQVVLLGYPPFLKGIIDEGRARGVPWPRYRIKLVMAGEVFSEEWRSLVGERTGATAPCFDSATLYGTADAGVLGCETPLSIAIRRFLAGRPDAARALFGESRLPTLVQYDPLSRFFEVQDGALLFSGDNGIPLVRYNILDTGGVISYATMLAFLANYNFDPRTALPPKTRGCPPLPFVYVFGRSDFTVSYFGANIYPENVTVGLEQSPIKDWVTGKFVLQVTPDSDQNPRLTLLVEMAPGLSPTEEKQAAIAASVQTHLLRLNSEYAHYIPEAYRAPQVRLLPTGDPEHFPAGVKHRYTRQ